MIRVNGEPIDPNLIDETFSRIKSEAELRLQVACCEKDPEFRKEAEEEVTDSILIAQEAEKKFPTIPEDELQVRLKEAVALYREHGASWDMLDAQKDYLRSETTATLRMEKFLDQVMEGNDSVSEAEIQECYEEFSDDYRSLPEVRCLHLMKGLEAHGNPSDLYWSLCELRERAMQGEDFEALAKSETDHQEGIIDLGWVPFDRPHNSFEAVMFSLKQDEVSPVMSYENALHLIKVIELKPAVVTPLEEIYEEVKERAEVGKKRAALQAVAQELRKTAVVERIESEDEDE